MSKESQPWADFNQSTAGYVEVNPRLAREHEGLILEAMRNPGFDYFSARRGSFAFWEINKNEHHFMPKREVGEYVRRQGFPVPLISTPKEWQDSMRRGTAILRSEHPQDYDGLSGVVDSRLLYNEYHYPKSKNGEPEHIASRHAYDGWYGAGRKYEGPLQAKTHVTPYMFDSPPQTEEAADLLRKKLFDGSVSIDDFMYYGVWQNQLKHVYGLADEWGYGNMLCTNLDYMRTSRWEYIPGVNIRIFRDPVIDGKYYIGGRDAHHTWIVTDGYDSPDVEAHTKRGWRNGETPETREYTLPTNRIINMYEQIRNLPYFDQAQAPVMELQYGDDGQLYFLQYLKTGHTIKDPGEFRLPTGSGIVTINEVRGITKKHGESVKIYLDPSHLGWQMHGQGFYMDFDLSHGMPAQVASSIGSVVVLNYMLSFKDNHYDSAPLYRPKVVLGLYSLLAGKGSPDAAARFASICNENTPRLPSNYVSYILASVVSNGRQATISSDWWPRTERLV
ncbi:MAG: hypothetical protein WBP26_01045 [Candidatus Saccharimonadales bacterium]